MSRPRSAGWSWEFLAFVAIVSTTLSLMSLNRATSQPSCLTTEECGAVLNGSLTCTDGRNVQNMTDCSDLCADASNGTQCATFDGNLCLGVVCQDGNCSAVDSFVPLNCTDGTNCTNDTCDVCANNCSGACVFEPINVTNVTTDGTEKCNRPLGEGCDVGGQCASLFCTDGVCCDSPCDGPFQSCNLPGSAGRCMMVRPTPTVSWRAMVLIVPIFAAIGLLGLRRALTLRQR